MITVYNLILASMRKSAETKYYKFATTSGKDQRSCDCVVRSISLAMGKTWEEVYAALCTIGLKMYRMPNEDKVYEKYLKDNGWEKQKMPKKENGRKYTGKEFSDTFGVDYPVAVISMRGHIAVMINGQFNDIWDCSDYSVGNFWIKK